MTQLFLEIIEWLSAVVSGWAGGATIIAVIAAVAALVYAVKDKPMPRNVALILTIVFVIIASFVAWREQYRSRLAAEQRLKELTTPLLIANVPQITTGNSHAGRVVLLLWVQMKNDGADSVAVGYGLRLSSGETIRPGEITDGFTVREPSGSVIRVY